MAHLAATVSRFISSLVSRAAPSTPASPSRRLQFMSDLHLEVGQQYASIDFPVTAPYLILGGDIGRLIDYAGYLAFLARQINRYQRIFLVLGNHEFYGTTYDAGVERARQLEHEPSLKGKVTLLDRGRHDLYADPESDGPGITLLGCVLWSQIAAESAESIATAVSDFKHIHNWTPDAHNAAHERDLSWLQTELGRIREEEDGDTRQVVIVTHHAPLVRGTASPKYETSPWTSAFATDLCTGAGWGPAKYWVFGHTHWTTDITAGNGVRVVSNQRGYVFRGNTRPVDQGSSGLPAKHTFDPARYIEF